MVRGGWEDLSGLTADMVFAAHVVYAALRDSDCNVIGPDRCYPIRGGALHG